MFTQLFKVEGEDVRQLVDRLEQGFAGFPCWKSQHGDTSVIGFHKLYMRAGLIVATLILEFVEDEMCNITVFIGGGGRHQWQLVLFPVEGVFVKDIEEYLNLAADGTSWKVTRVGDCKKFEGV